MFMGFGLAGGVRAPERPDEIIGHFLLDGGTQGFGVLRVSPPGQIAGAEADTGNGAVIAPSDRRPADFSGFPGISPMTGRRASAAFRRHTVTATIWPIGVSATTNGRSCIRLISCPL